MTRRSPKKTLKDWRAISKRIPIALDDAIGVLASEKGVSINEMYIELLTEAMTQRQTRVCADFAAAAPSPRAHDASSST